MASTSERIREFVIAGHGDLEKVRALLAEDRALLNARQQWGENDYETALQAAAHAGSAKVAEYLLAQGAPLDICTAAMLGRLDAVRKFLEHDPALIRAQGAHGIPLMTHAAFSGNVQLAQMLLDRGADEGMSSALFHAVHQRRIPMVDWLLRNGKPDLNWKNFQGKTALDVASEREDVEIVRLLRAHAGE